MEKRLQTPMNLGGDELARAAVQDDTIPAGHGGQVAMSRDVDAGEVVWQMSESELNKQLDDDANGDSAVQSTDLASLAAQPEDSTVDRPRRLLPTMPTLAIMHPSRRGRQPRRLRHPHRKCFRMLIPKSSIISRLAAPCRMIWKPQAAFAEFRKFNKGHPREADALFWLGRIHSFVNSLIWQR